MLSPFKGLCQIRATSHVDLERGVLTLPDTKAGGVQYVRLNEEAKMLLQRFILGNKSV
jgi:hypothetical protein